MIRTAILAGIFLVLLSIAYSRPGTGLLPALTRNASQVAAQADLAPKPAAPAKAVEAVPVAAAPATVAPVAPVVAAAPVEPLPPVEVAHKENTVALPAQPPVQAEAQRALVPDVAPPTAPAVAQAAALTVGQPVSLLPPAETVPARVAVAPPAALTPAEDLPLITVPARPVVTPWEAAPRTRAAMAAAAAAAPSAPAAVDAAAKHPDEAAPKLMTPQERSRELYRLAREMEDTFIHKLAR